MGHGSNTRSDVKTSSYKEIDKQKMKIAKSNTNEKPFNREKRLT